MTRAIGRRIDDYLVKPVSPLQIQAALKRQIEARKSSPRSRSRATTSATSRRSATGSRRPTTPADWAAIYTDLVTWSMDLFAYSDHGLLRTQAEQMAAANLAFAKYVREHYRDWITRRRRRRAAAQPRRLPHPGRTRGRAHDQVLWIIIDCMRLDQWRMIEPLLEVVLPPRPASLLVDPADGDAVRAQRAVRRAVSAGDRPRLPAAVARRGRRRGQPQRPRGRAARKAARAAGQSGRRPAAATTRSPTRATPTSCAATRVARRRCAWSPASTTSWTSWRTAAARAASSRNSRPTRRRSGP